MQSRDVLKDKRAERLLCLDGKSESTRLFVASGSARRGERNKPLQLPRSRECPTTCACKPGRSPPMPRQRGQANIWWKTIDKEHPKIYLQTSGEKDNTKMKPRKEKERNAQILYQNPGDRSEPCYIDAECRQQKSFLEVGFPQTC